MSGETVSELSREDVTGFADTFVRLMRAFVRARTRMLAAAQHDVEWSAHIMLKVLETEGPMRSSALADAIQSDPSTVSRQVAALVKDGLVERRADPVDGRASLLVLTDKAADVLTDHDDIRTQHFAHMLDGWSARDVHQFARLLERFTDTFEHASDTWITERIATRRASAEGNA